MESNVATEQAAPPAIQRPPADVAERMMIELSREQCLRRLATHHFGRLAVGMGTGAPLIRPVNYLFDRHSQSVVFRTASGSKFHALLRSAEAAFEVDGIDHIARTGWSVIILGVAEEITSPGEIRRLDRLGLKPWAPGLKPHWVHIRVRTVGGRRIAFGDESFPGYYLG